MPELHQNERLIINQLIDQSVFTSTLQKNMTNRTKEAIHALKRPQVQQRVNTYLRDLVGVLPENYQENLVFLFGRPKLESETVHLLLATLKTVINLPEMQPGASRIVSTQTIVRLVHSEVVALDEREVLRQITHLFVDRFKLFIPDTPEVQNNEITQEVTEFWDISPDFNYVAQAIVDYLTQQRLAPDLTPVQMVNRALLVQQYVSRTQQPDLFQSLVDHRDTIAAQWQQLQRFDLEVGEDYGLLLDKTRQPVTARAFVVGIAVAQQLGIGLPDNELNQLIRTVAPTIIGKSTVNPTEVKKTLLANSLVEEKDGFYHPTALIKRFDVATENEEDAVHATE